VHACIEPVSVSGKISSVRLPMVLVSPASNSRILLVKQTASSTRTICKIYLGVFIIASESWNAFVLQLNLEPWHACSRRTGVDILLMSRPASWNMRDAKRAAQQRIW
jgi:hypothetical protein